MAKAKFGVSTAPRNKPRKRPGRHTKSLNKHKKNKNKQEKRQKKQTRYKGQG